jgi:hypothetical protein
MFMSEPRSSRNRSTLFRASLQRRADGRYALALPRTSVQVLGSRAQMMVTAELVGVTWETLALPTGDGGHFVYVNKRRREDLSLRLGKRVDLKLTLRARRTAVAAPQDLLRVLRQREAAHTWWKALTPFQRRVAAIWIGQAKRAETRQRRIANVLRRARRAYLGRGPFFPTAADRVGTTALIRPRA